MSNINVNVTSMSGQPVGIVWDTTMIVSLTIECLIIFGILIVLCCCMYRFLHNDSVVHPEIKIEAPLNPSSDYRPPNRLSPIPSPTPMSFENCPRLICQEYIRSLNLPHAYFQSSHDKCFCPVDYPDTRPRIKKSGGYHYTVPCGWVRFALKTDQTLSRSQRIFQRWATSYYGTSENKIEEILENGFIPFPGDQLRNGTIFLVGFPGGRNDFCTSPSIEYISELHSGSRTRFLSHDGNTYEVQLILQCKQRPETFDIEPDESDWCDRIPNDTIVWKSNEQSTIVPCGVMVRARIFRQ